MSRVKQRMSLAAVSLVTVAAMWSLGAQGGGPTLAGQNLGGCEVEVRPKPALPLVTIQSEAAVAYDGNGRIASWKWIYTFRPTAPNQLSFGNRLGHDELNAYDSANSVVTFEYIVATGKLSIDYTNGVDNPIKVPDVPFRGTFDPNSVVEAVVDLVQGVKPNLDTMRMIVRTRSAGMEFDWTISDFH